MTDEELNKMTFNDIFNRRYQQKIIDYESSKIEIGQTLSSKIFETILCLLIMTLGLPFMVFAGCVMGVVAVIDAMIDLKDIWFNY
jgi:hypothetical protein